MIKLENFEVVGWEHAIRGMRNPMNSWAKSDSRWSDGYNPPENGISVADDLEWEYYIGPNDQALMMKLAKAGPVHAKYRRMIDVYVDITAPLYWWKEFDTYKVGTVANSCSTMHKIHEKEFTIDDFSCEHLSGENVRLLLNLVDVLNRERKLFVDGWKGVPGDDALEIKPGNKTFWWQMLQLLPSSYNQLRTVKFNYEVLAGIYEYRKDHKLDEWREFCKWIESLPYSELITGEVGGEE